MIKTIMAALLVMGMCGTVNAADQKLQDVLAATPQLNKNCSSQVIKSDRDEKSGKVSTVLLTAKHCVEGAGDSEMSVEFPVYQKTTVVAKKEYLAKVKGQSYKYDLALVELKDTNTLFENVIKLAPSELDTQIGDDVVTVGYPFGLALTVTKGSFGAGEVIDYPKNGTEYYRATPMIAGGNSGGGLYIKNAAGDYLLAGVTTAGLGPITFGGFYTPSYQIQDYLRTALPDVAEKKPEDMKKKEETPVMKMRQ